MTKPKPQQLRIPPHDLTAETAVIGSMFAHPQVIPRIAGQLSPSDFYSEAHNRLVEALFYLKDTSDLVTVRNWLQERNLLERIGGEDYLQSIAQSVPTWVAYERWCEIVRKHADRRRIIALCSTTAESCFSYHESAEDILSRHKREVRELELSRKRYFETNLDLAKKVFAIIEERSQTEDKATGLRTGFKNIDTRMPGLEAECTYYLSAESSVGKSALALNIAENVADTYETGHVLYFTLESTNLALMFRRYARRTRIALTRVKTGNIRNDGEWEDLVLASNELTDSRLRLFDDSRFKNLEYLYSFCQTYLMECSLLLVIVDYIQLMSSTAQRFQNRHLELSHISSEMNFLAKDLHCPVMIISQVNKDKGLKESGDIYNNADNEWRLERETKEAEEADLKCLKGKDLGTWATTLRFDRFIQRFYDE